MKMIFGLITLLAIFGVAYGSDNEEQVTPCYVIENENELQQDSLTLSEDEEWDETFPVRAGSGLYIYSISICNRIITILLCSVSRDKIYQGKKEKQ